MPTAAPAIAGFETDRFAHDGKERTVYRKGSGPAVIVMAEIPGITPKVIAFAERVAAIGCTAVMPHLFGVSGRAAFDRGKLTAAARMTGVIIPVSARLLSIGLNLARPRMLPYMSSVW